MIQATSDRRNRAEQAALLSAMLPGLGQWWSGRRWRGALWALPALAGLAVVFTVLFAVRRDGVTALLRILVQPRWLWLLLVANALLAVDRLASVVDAWLPLRRPASGSGGVWGLRAAAAVLALVMLMPHVMVHVYAVEALGLLDTVFDDPDLPSLAEREAAILAEGFSEGDLGPTTTSTTTAASATGDDGTTTSARPSNADLPGSDPIWKADDNPLGSRYTVLLAGGDFGPGRHDLRTDVMIVASLDLVAGKASLIGISRDLANAPLPEAWADADTMHNVQTWHEDQAYKKIVAAAGAAGVEPPPEEHAPFCNCSYDRINYLHVLTTTWVRTFPDAPDSGMEALRQTLEVLLGIRIDAYVLVDFAGFVDLVDALGGVRVTVTESLHEVLSPAREGEGTRSRSTSSPASTCSTATRPSPTCAIAPGRPTANGCAGSDAWSGSWRHRSTPGPCFGRSPTSRERSGPRRRPRCRSTCSRTSSMRSPVSTPTTSPPWRSAASSPPRRTT